MLSSLVLGEGRWHVWEFINNCSDSQFKEFYKIFCLKMDLKVEIEIKEWKAGRADGQKDGATKLVIEKFHIGVKITTSVH